MPFSNLVLFVPDSLMRRTGNSSRAAFCGSAVVVAVVVVAVAADAVVEDEVVDVEEEMEERLFTKLDSPNLAHVQVEESAERMEGGRGVGMGNAQRNSK